jgi:Helix-hairpin-helix domain
MTNAEITARLRAQAAEEARCGGNLYRVRALRQAAFAVTGLQGEAAELGPEALRLAGIGKSLSKLVMQWATEPAEVHEPLPF